MRYANIVNKAKVNLAKNNPNAAFDPAIVMIIAEIVIELIEAFQTYCGQDPDGALDISRNPGWLQKRVLRKTAFNHLGFRGYVKHGRDVVQSMLDTGKELTLTDMQEAYNE